MSTSEELAGEAVVYGLTFDNSDAWNHTAGILRAVLPSEGRCALAIVALVSCETEDAETLVRCLSGEAGPPVPPFDRIMSEANFWADLASRDELKAYSAAAFARLSLFDQSAFLGWAGGRAAA